MQCRPHPVLVGNDGCCAGAAIFIIIPGSSVSWKDIPTVVRNSNLLMVADCCYMSDYAPIEKSGEDGGFERD